MTSSTLIGKYEKGRSKLALYVDYIQADNSDNKIYPIASIKEISFEKAFWGWNLRLVRNTEPSAELSMDPEEFHALLNDLRDLITKNPQYASSSLAASLPIKSFFYSREAIFIYNDRIVQTKPFGLATHSIDEIKEVRSNETSISGMTMLHLPLNLNPLKKTRIELTRDVQLIMHNGTKSFEVSLKPDESEACQQFLERHIQVYRENSNAGPVVIMECHILGGSDIKARQGTLCTVKFDGNSVHVNADDYRFEMPFHQITELEIDGPGLVETNAGIVGGGFGVPGAILGMGIAALANALTTKSTINTILHLRWTGGELFLHSSSHTPEETRLILSHVFSALKPQITQQTSDITSQLLRLKELKDSGALTEEEFSAAKMKVITGS